MTQNSGAVTSGMRVTTSYCSAGPYLSMYVPALTSSGTGNSTWMSCSEIALFHVGHRQGAGLGEPLPCLLLVAPRLDAGVGTVTEPRRRSRDDACDTRVSLHRGVVDRLNRTETVAPHADALVALGLREIQPRRPVLAAVVDDLVRRAELGALAVENGVADGVVPAIVHPYGGAAVLKQLGSKALEGA